MRMDDNRRQALTALWQELADTENEVGQFEIDSATLLRFQELQDRIRGEVRRERAAESLDRVRAIASEIREGIRGTKLREAVESLRQSFGSQPPALVASFRSLQQRTDADEVGMLEDLIVIEEILKELNNAAE